MCKCLLTPVGFAVTLNEWQDSLRVESVITKSTHFVALLEYPRNSPHRAAWVSFLSCLFEWIWVAAGRKDKGEIQGSFTPFRMTALKVSEEDSCYGFGSGFGVSLRCHTSKPAGKVLV